MIPGPSNWAGDCSTGKRQSPIDIETANATPDKGMGAFTLTNYNKTLNKTFTASNNGHALVMTFPGRVYNVTGGGLNDTYTTVQFHFHWGANNTVGSEHTVNGKQYAAEVSENRSSLARYAIVMILKVLNSQFPCFPPAILVSSTALPITPTTQTIIIFSF